MTRFKRLAMCALSGGITLFFIMVVVAFNSYVIPFDGVSLALCGIMNILLVFLGGMALYVADIAESAGLAAVGALFWVLIILFVIGENAL